MPRLPRKVRLEWSDPPHVYRGAPRSTTIWDSTVDRLKTKPGKWARLVLEEPLTGPAASQLAVRLRKREGLEVTSRKTEVWARWVGKREAV